jgi:hypothetical protein
MEKTTHNGWMNYATWRVNLEVFDSMNPEDLDLDRDQLGSVDLYELAESMKYYAEQMILEGTSEGLAKSFAIDFLADVHWYEIAEMFVEAHRCVSDETRSFGG